MACKHEYRFSKYCGAYVCVYCHDHKDLAQCYCGWSKSGRHVTQEDFDEPIEPEEDIPMY